MQSYKNFKAFYGDLHNHCNISYGVGSLDDALSNAREQLDFCSVTGHAHWPDMPDPNARNQYLIDFHLEGFAKLKKNWENYMRQLSEANTPGKFITFPSFEIHSCADGDRTILYKDLAGEIIYAKSIADLDESLYQLEEQGIKAIAFPHHIGYQLNQRGLNWSNFNSHFAPVVEVVSMHGCSETDFTPRPMLHDMGPCDYRSSAAYGLESGNIFGFIGCTDHHSAFPGSYGHGRTGVWAKALDRESLWDAIVARRTYAMTGDRIELKMAVNGLPIGAVGELKKEREIEVDIVGGSVIDYVDVIKNGSLMRRFSQPDVTEEFDEELIHTKIHLELGWGPKHVQGFQWHVRLGIDKGRIINVEPRFRGKEVVAPMEAEGTENLHSSSWKRLDATNIQLDAISHPNPTNSTPMGQGICLEVEMPRNGKILAQINNNTECIPLLRLLEGSLVGSLHEVVTPFYVFHRAPWPKQFKWKFRLLDEDTQPSYYHIRMRQANNQWAWSSPVFLK